MQPYRWKYFDFGLQECKHWKTGAIGKPENRKTGNIREGRDSMPDLPAESVILA